MPAEIEVPTEHLHETIHEKAHGHGHGEGGEAPPAWISQVALSAAILAVLAAVAALQAGHHANEAMLDQMQATDQWSLFQAKSIKRSLVETKIDILTQLGKEQREEDKKNIERYEKEKEKVEEQAREKEHHAEHHMAHHVVLARAVTVFQVAIALSAISALTRKKLVWFGSVAVGILGTVFLVQGMM
jgi:hypothetical protein